MNRKYKSIAVWPASVNVDDPNGKNETDDTHATRLSAECVCKALQRDGLGGERKVFPISTRVEEVTNNHFPLAEKPFTGGMVIDLSGVLDRAADQCNRSRDNKRLEFPLRELVKHIEHLRKSESDEQALQRLEQFLRLWVD